MLTTTRVTPYLSYSYERGLIEYCGSVIDDPTNLANPLAYYATPGLTITKLGPGVFEIFLSDKLPLYAEIGNSFPPANNLSAIDAGFASTASIWVSPRPETVALGTPVSVVGSVPLFPNKAKVNFLVKTTVNNLAADVSFSFKIWVSGQMNKFVQGLGA